MAYRPDETGGISADEPASELASPWVRLVAVIIDALIYFAVAVVAGIVGFLAFGGEIAAVVLAVISAIVVFVIQMVLLGSRGQTIGKIAMKVRIIDSVTGMHPGWARLVLLRTILHGILTGIPFVGGIYWLVDALFIFRADHRTIHDLIAGTRVDKVAE